MSRSVRAMLAQWARRLLDRCTPGVGVVTSEAAGGPLRVEHARHPFTVVDLQIRIGEQGRAARLVGRT